MLLKRPIVVYLFVVLIAMNTILSCTSTKTVPYFQEISDTSKPLTIQTADYKDPVIQVDDILSITIQTIDAQATAALNLNSNASTIVTSPQINQQQVSGYLVDKNGVISIPLIGNIKVKGLTTYAARDTIASKVAEFYKSPTVQVRFQNFKVTVIGEVLRPATYSLPNEKVTIIDALGLAGDLTIFGRRENILLIREVDNNKQFVRLNLNSTSIISSPYFYLKQNDVIYVEPNKSKIVSTDAVRNRAITVAASAISVLIILATRVIK